MTLSTTQHEINSPVKITGLEWKLNGQTVIELVFFTKNSWGNTEM